MVARNTATVQGVVQQGRVNHRRFGAGVSGATAVLARRARASHTCGVKPRFAVMPLAAGAVDCPVPVIWMLQQCACIVPLPLGFQGGRIYLCRALGEGMHLSEIYEHVVASDGHSLGAAGCQSDSGRPGQLGKRIETTPQLR